MVMSEDIPEFDYSRPVHWLPRPVNEVPMTACSLDVIKHPRIQFTASQNEATCGNCRAFRGGPAAPGEES
jgi:hypothetical protein